MVREKQEKTKNNKKQEKQSGRRGVVFPGADWTDGQPPAFLDVRWVLVGAIQDSVRCLCRGWRILRVKLPNPGCPHVARNEKDSSLRS